MSVRLSIHMEQRDFHQTEFSEISCLAYLLKFYNTLILVKIGQK
jgi:hypothetical protein